MYRIRLASGEESVYRSIEELALAIRSGLLDEDAQVYHVRTGRWIRVAEHPHYREAIQETAYLPEEEWEEYPPEFEADGDGDLDLDEEPAEDGEDEIEAGTFDPTAPPVDDPYEARISEIHWVPRDYDPERTLRWTVMTLVALAAVMGSAALVRLAWREVPPTPAVADTVPTPSPEQRALARFDSLNLTDLMRDTVSTSSNEPRSVGALMRNYQGSYREAQRDMDEALGFIGFRQPFAPGRLSGPDSLRAARRTLAAAMNVISVYRSMEVRIERSYRDTMAYVSARNRWTLSDVERWESRDARRESFAVARHADSLLQAVDRLYQILLDPETRYIVAQGTVYIKDETTARSYAEQREWITRRLDAWSYTPGGMPPTIARLVRLIGASRPPPLAI